MLIFYGQESIWFSQTGKVFFNLTSLYKKKRISRWSNKPVNFIYLFIYLIWKTDSFSHTVNADTMESLEELV